MSFKISGNCAQKNRGKWKQNFNGSKTPIIQQVKVPLFYNNEIPKESAIIGRYIALSDLHRFKNKRVHIISGELNTLWTSTNKEAVELKNIYKKVLKLINTYYKSQKRKKFNSFEKPFDISYMKKNCVTNKTKSQNIVYDIDSISEISDEEESGSEDYISTYKAKSTISPIIAASLVTNLNISTSKASLVCKQLSEAGVSIATPSQKTIHRHVKKNAERKETVYIQNLNLNQWALHFDGKKINKKEVQVVVLKNETEEIKLGVLVLEDGRACTIFNGIKELLDKFNLWASVKMIISDTTSVNTGKNGGVVRLLQDHVKSLSLPPPQYIGCQHHILDLILRHAMDEILGGKTSSPNIEYHFVPEIVNAYEHLIKNYKQNEERVELKNIKWRDDMQYLYELCVYFKYYMTHGKFPYIKFKAIPPISNARWNSRAILAILAFVLLPKYKKDLYSTCVLITGAWFDVWFSDHRFNVNNYENLKQGTIPFKKAHACFLKHWVKEESAIPQQQRSNICAERSIKVVQDIFPLCKSTRALNLKFISHK